VIDRVEELSAERGAPGVSRGGFNSTAQPSSEGLVCLVVETIGLAGDRWEGFEVDFGVAGVDLPDRPLG
jgi:hypothetical protein